MYDSISVSSEYFTNIGLDKWPKCIYRSATATTIGSDPLGVLEAALISFFVADRLFEVCLFVFLKVLRDEREEGFLLM